MKNHFSLHQRTPGHEIAGGIADIQGTGWSVSRNEEYYGIPGYGVDMVDGVLVRIYPLPRGHDRRSVDVAGFRLELGEPLPRDLQAIVGSIGTEVDHFYDWSYGDCSE